MTLTPSYLEWEDSQRPALELLIQTGYTYLSPEQALTARGGSISRVLLETILAEQLRKINRIEYKGATYAFSDENIFAAIEALRTVPDLGLVRTNEGVYDLLTLGKSFQQTIAGDRKSFNLRYIDWHNLHNNTFHIVPEFEVSGLDKPRRPDLVLFVNGIPFAVIECKRRDKNQSVDEGVAQMRRNQQHDVGIPRLFHYTQLLLSAQPNEVRYGTTGTERKYWSVWREDGLETQVKPFVGDRLPTEQDRCLYALCRPERLFELSYQYMVFEAGEKKIARYQQYFAVQQTLARVRDTTRQGQRRGGVIWHTQGSGKSLTMVMLAKALSLCPQIDHPRVVVVTDRIDLDNQIWKTFHYCGKEPVQARTGEHLLALLDKPTIQIITTLIDKFDAAAKKQTEANPAANIFCLVDESHRSQHGLMHIRMKKILPNACYLGFTGTPLMKHEKSTMQRFGGLIHQYTLRDAVPDGAVVPLLYEGRLPLQEINRGQLDKGLSRIAEGLSEEQTNQLKKKAATEEQVFSTGQNIEEIAYDITQHYTQHWQGTGCKAQLAVPKKKIALKFYKYFRDEGKIEVACLISQPDEPEGEDDNYDPDKESIRSFWKQMMERFGSEDKYNKQTISNFRDRDDGIELIIVVDKLLTGFDAPRNTILYLARKMTDHTLLQAIARVNRPREGKDFGYILDYRGNLENLDKALTAYNALAEYDEADLEGSICNVMEEFRKLPQYHSEVREVFKEVEQKEDVESLERFLADEEYRHLFYEKLARFGRTLQAALGSEQFHQEVPEKRIEFYLGELKFYCSLRNSARKRYAETIDIGEYEERIHKLMDQHLTTEAIVPLTAAVSIFDQEAFARAVAGAATPASKADFIAHRVKKTLTERMDEDPARYRRFSDMIQQAIDAFRQKRLSEMEYLHQVEAVYDQLIERPRNLPELLSRRPEARPYYHVLSEVFAQMQGREVSPDMSDALAQAGVAVEELIAKLKIVDWKHNPDAEKNMRNAVEDYLLELGKQLGVELSFDQIDLILDQTIQIAKS